MMRRLDSFLLAVAACTLLACGATGKIAVLAARGPSYDLRDDRASEARPPRPGSPLLIVALDGMKRAVLYDLLRTGRLPGLTALLGGGTDDTLPHAYLSDAMIAGLPSITIVGWAQIFSGMPPAANGVTGNEIFLREEKRLAAPIPGSFHDAEPALATYTEGYAEALLRVPTLYERLRADDPGLTAWVSVSQFHRGADRLLTAERRSILGKAYASALDTLTWQRAESYEERDHDILETVIDELADDEHPVPDVLTVYATGGDGTRTSPPKGPTRRSAGSRRASSIGPSSGCTTSSNAGARSRTAT